MLLLERRVLHKCYADSRYYY